MPENDRILQKRKNIPDEKMALFEAPFFNVTRSGVCLGSAKIEKPDNPSLCPELMLGILFTGIIYRKEKTLSWRKNGE